MNTDFDQFAYAFGKPLHYALIRQAPEDFQVEEILGFSPSGEGEHVFLHVRKRDWNTDRVARQLAKFCGIKQRDVSYAGMKDRHAITTQWFSVHLPGQQAPEWRDFSLDGITILAHSRHQRKLKRGTLEGNHFTLTLRDVNGGSNAALEHRLQQIAQQGVPNYFGPQRFGENNLANALAMFAGERKVKDRHLRSLYISAARSWLFNQVLSMRVRLKRWHRALPGDALQLDGSNSFFTSEQLDQTIHTRTQNFDIHPTGPLYGVGDTPLSGVAATLENKVLSQYEDWQAGLRHAKLSQARRAMRMRTENLTWTFEANNILRLNFYLYSGSYATSVLRELVIT
ncbi:MAG: tRNA pseudouridine(13) synthase TruD [Pseudomonadota bacterium]